MKKYVPVMMFPIPSDVAKSLSLSFNPIEKSKRVAARSAIVCKPAGVSKPAKIVSKSC